MRQGYLNELIERYHTAMFTVTKRAQQALRSELGDDLTLEQFSVMRYIRGNPLCTSTALADVFCVGKSTITSLTTKLADKALLVRLPDADDRRIIRLELTEAGKRVARRVDREMERWLSGYLRYFSMEEIEAFIGSFEKLAALTSTEEKGSGAR